MKTKTITATQLQFDAINGAYLYFNEILFGKQLPGCILNFSRKMSAHGFMAPERWKRVGDSSFTIHEISLTPTTLYREPIEVFSTLVHEMAHLIEPTHGDRFIAILEEHYPSWREARAELNELPLAAESWKE